MNGNTRTTFENIVRREGLSPCPRLLQILRARRETALVDQYPVRVVTAWPGNAPTIALRRDPMVTDEYFAIAKARGAQGGHGRSLQRPPTVEGGLDQLVRDGDLWLRRYLLLVEVVDEEAGAESRSKTLGDALHALLESAGTKKERRELARRLRPAAEELAAVLGRLRDCCGTAAMRQLDGVPWE